MAQKKMQEQALMAEIEGVKVKRKYEYDSDEETEGGTWEHRQRATEMEATKGLFHRACTSLNCSSSCSFYRFFSMLEFICDFPSF